MTAERGDRKPCTVTDCPGTMQYGRRQDQEPRALSGRGDLVPAAESVKGWVCSAARDHFREQ